MNALTRQYIADLRNRILDHLIDKHLAEEHKETTDANDHKIAIEILERAIAAEIREAPYR